MFLNKIIQYTGTSKTKYRIVSDGIVWHLQYQQESILLSLFKIQTWKYVWRPYADSSGGRLMDGCGYKTYVCSYNCVLNEFIKKWTDINDYFLWAAAEQIKLEEVKRQSFEMKKSEGKYSNLNSACFN